MTIQNVVDVARFARRTSVSVRAMRHMARSRTLVEAALVGGRPHYGVNTGFGSLSKQRIAPGDLRDLQRNLVRSHSAGIGESLRREVVRGMMLILAASLARGMSGTRPVIARTLSDMLSRDVTPVVPSIGSVGASGDLAPLAHLALALIGEGRATIGASPRIWTARQALRKARITPVALEAKEGLALINGTHLMCAEGALLVNDSRRLWMSATLALAMSMDACRATDSFLDSRLYAGRNNIGALAAARLVARHLDGSRIIGSHVENDSRVQDPYSLRAGPTILAPILDTIEHLELAISDELGAVTDNPLVFPRGPISTPLAEALSIRSSADAIVSGANFHGMPLAIPLDSLAIALCHLGGASERRTYLITGAFEPESHLKPFLAPKPGLQSGLMIAQYTAAACVNEMVGLAAPASVANVTTCAGMEDYNSFGPRAAAKARRSLELAEHVVAIELLCAAQALELHRPLRSGVAVEKALRNIRYRVPALTGDRPLTADIEAIVDLIREGAFA
ncbi:MAG: histidine ammonia-lyase [Phycisphaerae bacterium]|nr:histidine ammonia-lyase [Phycisphaerae bacterium]